MISLNLKHSLLGLASLGLLSGCVVTGSTYVYDRGPEYRHRDVVVEEPAYVVVRSDVPQPPAEVIVAQPGPGYIWVSGYYAPQGQAWVWVPGGWTAPPRPGAVWIAPRYERRSAAEVRFSAGHWNVGAAVVAPIAPPPPQRVVVAPGPAVVEPGVVVVHTALPPVRVERIPPAPGPGLFWIKGYYVEERGGWRWVAGHYERPPRPGAIWVEPRYEPHGADIHFSLGFWR